MKKLKNPLWLLWVCMYILLWVQSASAVTNQLWIDSSVTTNHPNYVGGSYYSCWVENSWNVTCHNLIRQWWYWQMGWNYSWWDAVEINGNDEWNCIKKKDGKWMCRVKNKIFYTPTGYSQILLMWWDSYIAVSDVWNVFRSSRWYGSLFNIYSGWDAVAAWWKWEFWCILKKNWTKKF